MLDPACTKVLLFLLGQLIISVLLCSVQVPSLVLGPFGCGKTRTLNECIRLLASHVTEARVLICTLSNSAANLYVESIHKEWMGEEGLFVCMTMFAFCQN